MRLSRVRTRWGSLAVRHVLLAPLLRLHDSFRLEQRNAPRACVRSARVPPPLYTFRMYSCHYHFTNASLPALSSLLTASMVDGPDGAASLAIIHPPQSPPTQRIAA